MSSNRVSLPRICRKPPVACGRSHVDCRKRGTDGGENRFGGRHSGAAGGAELVAGALPCLAHGSPRLACRKLLDAPGKKSARCGSLPVDGGVEALFRGRLTLAGDSPGMAEQPQREGCGNVQVAEAGVERAGGTPAVPGGPPPTPDRSDLMVEEPTPDLASTLAADGQRRFHGTCDFHHFAHLPLSGIGQPVPR